MAAPPSLSSQDEGVGVVERVAASAAALDALLRSADGKPAAMNQELLKVIDVCARVPSVAAATDVRPLLAAVRALLAHPEKALRAQALRATRYLLTDSRAIEVFLSLSLDVLTARALDREAKYVWERTQAVKLIQAIMAVDAALVPRTLTQSLIAVAEAPKDDLMRACLDTLRELVIANPALVAQCNGVRTLVHAVMDPSCLDIAGSITLTLIYLLDKAATRRYVRLDVELQPLFAVFTDTGSPNDKKKEARRAAAHKVLVTFMRSWTGILCLAQGAGGLRSLVDVLALPPEVKGGSWAKEAVFELLFEVLHVVRSEDLQNISGANLWDEIGPNLLYNYVVVVVHALVECGFVQVLTDLSMSHDSEYSGIAQTLLTRMLRLAADLFPRRLTAAVHTLPSVMERAAAFKDADFAARHRASNMVCDLERMARELGGTPFFNVADHASSSSAAAARALEHDELLLSSQLQHHHDKPHPLARHLQHNNFKRLSAVHGIDVERLVLHADPSASYEHYIHLVETSRGGNPQSGPVQHQTERVIEELRFQHDLHMADESITRLLKESAVVVSKDFHDWNTDVCLELLEGPLATTRGLALALNTKFIKRLCSFLRPEKEQFSALPWTLENMKYVRVACQLFRVLCNSREGSSYQFFQLLVEQLFTYVLAEAGVSQSSSSSSGPSTSGAQAESDVDSGGGGSGGGGGDGGPELVGRPFSRESIKGSLSREYFTLLGILSTSEWGPSFFDKHNVYDSLYRLEGNTRKEYLMRGIVVSLDYHKNKKARTLLDMWVKAGSVELRKFVISQLRLLLKRHVPDFWQWGVSLLVTQLQWASDSDPSRVVPLMALNVLEEACAEDTGICMRTLIKKKPDFSLVGDHSNNILTTFLGTPHGVEFLNRIGWIEPQLAAWRNGGGNRRYVDSLESALVKALNSVPGSSGLAIDEPTHAVRSGDIGLRPDLPLDGGTGFVGEFGGFGGFRAAPRKLRSPADEYFFDRVHQLPWHVRVELETPRGKVSRITDTVTYTVPVAAEEDALETYVVAVLMDQDGLPSPCRVDPNVSVRATLSVGGMSDGDDGKAGGGAYAEGKNEAVCEPGARADGRRVVWDAQRFVRWEFDETGRLATVWFRIPTPSTTPPAVSLAPHLYGELARTQEGCLLLASSGYFREMIDMVRCLSFLTEDEDDEEGEVKEAAAGSVAIRVQAPGAAHAEAVVQQPSSSLSSFSTGGVGRPEQLPHPKEIRAALWGVGQVGGSAFGFELLQETDVVRYICEQARTCPTLSMRGTCFYVLGLLSRTEHGRAELEALGWRACPHPSVGVVLPEQFSDMKRIATRAYRGAWALSPANKIGIQYVPVKGDEDPNADPHRKTRVGTGALIIGHISNLGNAVTQKSSIQSLQALRQQHPDYFLSVPFFFEVCKLLSAYRFKLNARRFILFDLFGKVGFSLDALTALDGPADVTDKRNFEKI